MADVITLKEIIHYNEGAVVSRTLVDKPVGTITLFAFDAGQGLSEHSAPYDAVVQVIEGEGVFVIGGVEHNLKEGQMVIMPSSVPHSVRAEQEFKMLLTMIRA
ncbi:MAG: cupin domain-containing protein [Candidatus Methanoperedenaceae archaeon]|nr:cupin domain-containing protein [Candidatus Methanoperedenaceae archaeon]MDW7726010.1 cupin domain-containing protein [Candidatus Methanoperedens sp.]